jgi:hypothetical protein
VFPLTSWTADSRPSSASRVRKCLHPMAAAYLGYFHEPQAEADAAERPRACFALTQTGWKRRKRLFKFSDLMRRLEVDDDERVGDPDHTASDPGTGENQ